jgi:nicotinamide/nicotinate riboside kinase
LLNVVSSASLTKFIQRHSKQQLHLLSTSRRSQSIGVRMAPTTCLLVGLSGPSSSGKTTIARLLRDILPNAFILHEDDFYKTDIEIPINKEHNLEDWDCLESINLPALESALKHVKANGALPSDLESKEDQNSVGKVNVDADLVERLKQQASSLGLEHVRVAIVDGFLLYSQEMATIRDTFDVKLFLRTDYETAKRRREARSGYVTLEGFWADPPGYVDKIVWPNYVKDHQYLFQNDDVEGDVNGELVNDLGIDVMPAEKQGDLSACLAWAYDKLETALRNLDA